MAGALTAKQFVVRLKENQSDDELRKIQRYFKSGKGEYGEGDRFIGVRMGTVFALAKEFIALPPAEIERLMESPIHEARAGAMSIMAKQYGHKNTSDARRKELFDLYLRRHDRINNWDLVDLAAWHVVGRHLVERPRKILHKLARSRNMWERRTAVLATMPFSWRGETEDAFAIARILMNDTEDLIHKAAGWALRETGRKDGNGLRAFLDKHAATMPRTMLRAAIERFDRQERSRYLAMKAADGAGRTAKRAGGRGASAASGRRG
jgi:3-methyladenine DNA glycosylase AlkD